MSAILSAICDAHVTHVQKPRRVRAKVLSGIPQGNILGPILFTIFINDLPNWVSSCKIFADDTKLYDVASNHVQIQTDIDALQRWSDKWNLYFNTDKCKVMHIGLNNQRYNYTMRLYNDEIVNITKCDNVAAHYLVI